ncbi:MAG: CBS domain-containing protein [Leptospiraceae bacterium]|nr:CBS domain-containing protein [Leptospiraceae bacterium]
MIYKTIKSEHLHEEIGFHRPDDLHKQQITLDAPAINVMTDLKRVSLVTTGLRESIDTAHEKMRNRGVRMLVVINGHDAIVGIITARDILGEKPVKFATENNVKHGDITVKDIMNSQIEVFSIAEIAKAKVGDVVHTLKEVHRQHGIVVDNQGPNNEKTVRGIISLSQIARQLGKKVDALDIKEMVNVILS